MSLSRLLALDSQLGAKRHFGKFLLPMPPDAKMKNIVKLVSHMMRIPALFGKEVKDTDGLAAVRLAKKKKEEKMDIAWKEWHQAEEPFMKLKYRFQGIPLPGEKQSPEPMLTTIYGGTGFGQTYTPPASFKFPEMPKDYKEHPDRDLVNFPYPAASPYPPKHRLTVFPESWFKALEPITGTSGGYLLAFGVLNYLISKEYLIWPMLGLHQTWFAWFAVALFLCRYRIQQQVYAKGMDFFAKHTKIIDDDLQMIQDFKKIQSARLHSLTSSKAEFPRILEDYVKSTFEDARLRNVATLKKEVKRHVDFLKESEAEKQRLESTLFVNAILQGVKKQIETNEGGIKDKYMDYCIEQLRVLASRPNALG